MADAVCTVALAGTEGLVDAVGLNKEDSAATVLWEEAQLSACSSSASIELYTASHESKPVCIATGRSVVTGLKVVVYVMQSADCLLRRLSRI